MRVVYGDFDGCWSDRYRIIAIRVSNGDCSRFGLLRLMLSSIVFS